MSPEISNEDFLNQEGLIDDPQFKSYVENINQFTKIDLCRKELETILYLAKNNTFKDLDKIVLDSIIQKSSKLIKVKKQEILNLEERTKGLIAQLINKGYNFPDDIMKDYKINEIGKKINK